MSGLAGLAAEVGRQARLLDAPDARQAETRRRQFGRQRQVFRRAGELEETGEAAVEPVGAEFRRRDVDAQAVAGAAEGAAGREPVRPGRQLHVGARDARPVDGKIAAPGQRLAGETAVAQRELRLDDGTRLPAGRAGHWRPACR